MIDKNVNYLRSNRSLDKSVRGNPYDLVYIFDKSGFSNGTKKGLKIRPPGAGMNACECPAVPELVMMRNWYLEYLLTCN
jgi:hypothetical protein